MAEFFQKLSKPSSIFQNVELCSIGADFSYFVWIQLRKRLKESFPRVDTDFGAA